MAIRNNWTLPPPHSPGGYGKTEMGLILVQGESRRSPGQSWLHRDICELGLKHTKNSFLGMNTLRLGAGRATQEKAQKWDKEESVAHMGLRKDRWNTSEYLLLSQVLHLPVLSVPCKWGPQNTQEDPSEMSEDIQIKLFLVSGITGQRENNYGPMLKNWGDRKKISYQASLKCWCHQRTCKE